MDALTVMSFISKHGEETASLFPLGKSEEFIQKLLDAGQVLLKYNKGQLVGVCTYYRTPTEEMGKVYTHDWNLPPIYNKGPYLFVDQVVVHPKYRHQNVMNQFIKKLNYLNPPVKYGMWNDENGEWHKQDKEYSMKTNCGIVAFDKISGMLNGRSNVISLATLAQIAQDNEFLLYPMKVKADQLQQLATPYVLHSDFHFETITDPMDLLGVPLEDEVYVLTTTPDVGELVDADEAKKVRGSKKAMRWIAPIGLGILGSIVAPGIGSWLGTSLGMVGSAGLGALGTAAATGIGAGLGTAAGNSLTGKPNWGGAAIAGGLAGGASLLGSALGGGASKAASTGTSAGTGINSAGLSAIGFPASGAPAMSGLSLGTGINSAGLASLGFPSSGAPSMSPIGGAATAAAPTLLGSLGNSFNSNPLVQGAKGIGNTIKGAFSPATATGATAGGSAMGSSVPIGTAAGTPGIMQQAASAMVGGGGSGSGLSGLMSKVGIPGLLGAGMLGYNMLRKSPSIDTSAYDDYAQQMQMMYAGGGNSPYAQMAIPELKRGIGAGVEGIFPSTDSKWYTSQLAQKQSELATAQKNLGNQYAAFGRVNSPEHIQALTDLETNMGQQMDTLKAQMSETNRSQNIGGMQQYLDLAMRGDQNAFAGLAQALGSAADAKAAMSAYQAGFQESRLGTIGQLGSSLISNQFNPMNDYLKQIAANTGSMGFGRN